MKIFLKLALIAVITLSVGCATRNRSGVIIDSEGVDMSSYQRDLAECQRISQQVDQKVAGGAVGGAVVGGVIGAIVGNRSTVARTAGVGAVTGGVGGAGSTHQERQRVVKNCLRNRGYRVLN